MSVTAASGARAGAGAPRADVKGEEEEEGGIALAGSLLSTSDGNQTIGSGSFSARGPGYSVDEEKGTTKASAGSIAADVTFARTRGTLEFGDITGTGTVGTLNAHAEAAASGTLKGLKGSAKVSAGAEAMLVDGRVEGTLNLTAKTITDLLSGAYNTIVDPVVDAVAGRDVPGLPEAPEGWDRGLVLGGHLEGGFGASAKAHAGVEREGGGPALSGGFKIGLGPVYGVGGSVGLKLE